MKNILIIGGAGFVGSNLAFKLKNDNYKVTVLDNLVRRGAENNIPIFKKLGISFIHGDTRNKEDINCLDNYDVILDCAAQPSAINYKNPNFDITNNTYGVLNVLDYCRDRKAGLIFWSTNKCYTGKVCNSVKTKVNKNRLVFDMDQDKFDGFDAEFGFNENLTLNGNDHSIYGVSKVMADLMIQEYADAYKIPSICNRFSCLAGPNQWGKAEQGWMTWFAIANKLKLPIEVYGFDGLQVRDYLFIDDIYNLIKKQIENIDNYFGEVFNVGGGNEYSTSIKEAIGLIENNYSKFTDVKYFQETRRADQAVYISDNRKVKKAFNWEPSIKIEQGYEQIFEWINQEKTLTILEQIYN